MKMTRIRVPIPQFLLSFVLAVKNSIDWFGNCTLAVVSVLSASAGAFTALGFITNTGIGVFILAICILPLVMCVDISKRTDLYYDYEIERIQRERILLPFLVMLWLSGVLLIWAARFGPTL